VRDGGGGGTTGAGDAGEQGGAEHGGPSAMERIPIAGAKNRSPQKSAAGLKK